VRSALAVGVPPNSRRGFLLVVLTASVLAAGCRPGRVRPVLPVTLPPAERLLETLEQRRASVVSLRGFAHIAYESGEERLGGRHAVLVRQPDHFRLEVLSPLGALAVVASDGRELAVYVRSERRIYRGSATAESVAAYTGVPVAVEDVVAVLVGAPPYRPPVGAATVARDEGAALIRLAIPIAAGSQEVWFAPESLLPVASATALADGGILRTRFGDYRDLGAFPFPYAVELRTEPGDRAVRVRYGSPSLNQEVADGVFALPSRDGVEDVVIEAYPGAGPAT